ncbi:MAG: Uma2 family endonuclease [Blastocatellales bacterium]
MVTTELEYLTAIKAMPPGAVQLFNHVSWEEYEELLEALDEQPRYRLTFDEGKLEVMTVSAEHEEPAGLIPHLILVLAEESNLNFLGLRSTTLRKRKKAKGADPDDCYYFKDFKKIAGKKRLDLTVDPPPDLALEIDVTHRSLKKFSIYASIGVPEFWRYYRNRMEFYRLSGDDYQEITHSDLFPFLTPDVLQMFLQKGLAEGTLVMVKEFRQWVKTNKS